jgi:hypothetical protein
LGDMMIALIKLKREKAIILLLKFFQILKLINSYF